MKYILEIYKPGSIEVLQTFESSTPFTISNGDILNQSFFKGIEVRSNKPKILIIIAIEHIFWQHDSQKEPTQKTLVYTKEENDTVSARGIA